jgi:hypothetical protein
MAKAKAMKSKAGGARKSATKRKPAAKAKPATKTAASSKPKAKSKKAPAKRGSNILGGVAKGFAWLGDKVRGVVTRKKPGKKKAKAKAAKATKPAKAAPAADAQQTAPVDAGHVTLYNPRP